MNERFEFLVKFLCGEDTSPEGRDFADMDEPAINSRPRGSFWWRPYVRLLARIHRDEIADATLEREKLVAEVLRLQGIIRRAPCSQNSIPCRWPCGNDASEHGPCWKQKALFKLAGKEKEDG